MLFLVNQQIKEKTNNFDNKALHLTSGTASMFFLPSKVVYKYFFSLAKFTFVPVSSELNVSELEK